MRRPAPAPTQRSVSVVEREEGGRLRSDVVEMEDGGGRGGDRECGVGERCGEEQSLVDGADIVAQRVARRGRRKPHSLFLDGP
jgi:hypothetical protein